MKEYYEETQSYFLYIYVEFIEVPVTIKKVKHNNYG